MKTKMLISVLVVVFCASVTNAAKFYVSLDVDGNYITNVPKPVRDSDIVNKQYADRLYFQVTEVAATAKCAGGQIPGYTPIPGEDLHVGMQYGVDWSTNTRFTVDATDSNVYDNLTGLMWTKNANVAGTKNWTDAINYCANLDYGGYSDWRLPNSRELVSLIDLSREEPSLPDGNPFTEVEANFYWTSSTSFEIIENENVWDKAWYVDINTGIEDFLTKTSEIYVWAVRSY